MLADMRLKAHVLRLRREALEIARALIAEEHPEYDAMQLEAAACDLCDTQVQEEKEANNFEGESK